MTQSTSRKGNGLYRGAPSTLYAKTNDLSMANSNVYLTFIIIR